MLCSPKVLKSLLTVDGKSVVATLKRLKDLGTLILKFTSFTPMDKLRIIKIIDLCFDFMFYPECLFSAREVQSLRSC